MLNFWANKKVLITGHSGFKGSWLCFILQHLGAEVFGYSLEPDQDLCLYNLTKDVLDIHSYFGDIRDLEALVKFVKKSKPDIIFHLAAQPLVRDSYSDPVGNYSTNLMGTVHIMEAFRQCDSARAIVNVTTDKCYKNQEWLWGYREDDVLGGHDPYSNSKACSELITESYRKSFFTDSLGDIEKGVATARAGNVIGGGDWAKDRIIPDLYRSYMQGQTLEVRNKDAVRPWQHVLDPLKGYLSLAEKLYKNPKQFSQAWNFGPEDSGCISVENLLNHFKEIQPDFSWRETGNTGPHEARLLKLDTSKSKQILSRAPQLDVSMAVKFTADWYINHINQGPVIPIMESQISHLFELKQEEAIK